MRRPSAEVRERLAGAVRASRTGRRLTILARAVVAPSATIGSFLAFVGAFGSGEMPVLDRFALMIGVSLVATVLGFLSFAFAEGWPWARRPFWRLGLVSSLMMFAPMGLVVWTGVNLALPSGQGPAAREIPSYLAGSAVTTGFFCFLAAWIRRSGGNAASVQPRRPAFLDRVPLKLRGADIWAVEAEDHYLRLHTSKGQDLILLRLADAVAELDGIEGAQVHRSWWVAREAIADARRGDGRATIVLKDGSQVPVSRTYAGPLRERGWI